VKPIFISNCIMQKTGNRLDSQHKGLIVIFQRAVSSTMQSMDLLVQRNCLIEPRYKKL